MFDYGFNVETAGDHPVWHRSEVDVLPGHHASPSSITKRRGREGGTAARWSAHLSYDWAEQTSLLGPRHPGRTGHDDPSGQARSPRYLPRAPTPGGRSHLSLTESATPRLSGVDTCTARALSSSANALRRASAHAGARQTDTKYVVNAVVVEGRRVSEVCAAHGVSRSWLYELIGRYRQLGEPGLAAGSKRPRSSPTRVPAAIEDEIVALRKSLAEQGLDAGPHTIQVHLLRCRRGRARAAVPSVATIWRVLSRRGFIRPEPQKRPKSSWRRFHRATQ